MSEEQEQTYMTVGELAEKVGVTVLPLLCFLFPVSIFFKGAI